MLYNHPEYYELAFSFRDIASETEFMSEGMRRHSRIPVQTVLEIGCGPAPHAEELCRRGYRYTGLDINERMLDYARGKLHHVRPEPSLILGDMVGFTIPEPVDYAFVMLGSLYVGSEEELHGHFDSLSRSLRSGGLYFLDWCIQFEGPEESARNNTFEIQGNGITLKSHFDLRLLDAERRLYEETWRIDVDHGGDHHRFVMTERNVAILPDDFLSFLAERPDFERVGWWADWDFGHPIEAGVEIVRPVVLLRRTDAPAPSADR